MKLSKYDEEEVNYLLDTLRKEYTKFAIMHLESLGLDTSKYKEHDDYQLLKLAINTTLIDIRHRIFDYERLK